VQVPDNAVTIKGTTVSVTVHNLPEIDQHAFFDPTPPFGAVPSVASFTMSFTRSGAPRLVQPTTSDPNSATNWAGVMWTATGSSTFSVAYTDGTFAFHATGPTNSAGQFGEMGYEQNGVFLPGQGGTR
jgi:hypothetical protein